MAYLISTALRVIRTAGVGKLDGTTPAELEARHSIVSIESQ
jgi:hypothetical protein